MLCGFFNVWRMISCNFLFSSSADGIYSFSSISEALGRSSGLCFNNSLKILNLLKYGCSNHKAENLNAMKRRNVQETKHLLEDLKQYNTRKTAPL